MRVEVDDRIWKNGLQNSPASQTQKKFPLIKFSCRGWWGNELKLSKPFVNMVKKQLK